MFTPLRAWLLEWWPALAFFFLNAPLIIGATIQAPCSLTGCECRECPDDGAYCVVPTNCTGFVYETGCDETPTYLLPGAHTGECPGELYYLSMDVLETSSIGMVGIIFYRVIVRVKNRQE